MPTGFDAGGPALVLPLCTAEAAAGVLVVLRRSGARPFTAEQLDMMAAFADQAALAWQLAISQRRMRELDVLTDRDRIARDLHDHVIQRLFAVGLALQGTIPRARSAEVQQRLSWMRRRPARRHPGNTHRHIRSAWRVFRTHPAAAAARRGDRPVRELRSADHGCSSSDRFRRSTPHWPTTPKPLCARRSATPCGTRTQRNSPSRSRSPTISASRWWTTVGASRVTSPKAGWPACVGVPRRAAAPSAWRTSPAAEQLLRWSAPLP